MTVSRDPVELSPGDELTAGTTGWRYVVEHVDPETVVVRGPNGLLPVPRDALQQGVERGTVEVRP